MKRKKVNQRKAARSFTRSALRINPKNVAPPMKRGGYRI